MSGISVVGGVPGRRYLPAPLAHAVRWLSDRPGLWEPFAVFLVTRVAFSLLILASQLVLPTRQMGPAGPSPEQPLLNGWIRGDAGFYLEIAQGGYSFTPDKVNTGFFPLYPLLLRVVDVIVGNMPLTGLLVANLCFLGALLALYSLAEKKFDRATARRAIVFIAVFPYSLFFNSAYTESLFLLLAVLTFRLAEGERWWSSGVAGALCAFTRLVGGGLAPSLLLLYLEKIGYRWRSAGRGVLAFLIVPAGTLAYMGYLYIAFGNPTAFMYASLVVWGRFNVFEQGLARLNPSAFQPGNGDLLMAMHFVVAVLFLAAVVAVFRSMGPAYALFVFIGVVIPFSTQLESLGRFMSVLFPVFITLAYYLRRSVWAYAYAACSASLLGLLMALFANRYPIT